MRTSYFRDIAMAQDARFVQQKSTNPYLAGTGATQLTRQKSGWASPSEEELGMYKAIARARGIDDPSKIFHMLNRVAWHESAKTMDPKLKERTPKGSKWNDTDYGIGLFQYKKDSAITGAKRAKNFLTSQGVTVPDWILNLEKTGDVGSLDVSQQRILASLDMAENPKFAMGDASGSNEYLVKNWGKAWQTQSDPKKMDKFMQDQASYGAAYAQETDWRPTAPPPAPEQINNTVPVDNTATQIMVDPRAQMPAVQQSMIKGQQGRAVTQRDSIAHQANKILKYEQLKGGPGGGPLPSYADPRYAKMLMEEILPEVNKIMPKASAMEKAEAMDFIINAGWDKVNKKIEKDPRGYALQAYYKKYDPSKLDAKGKWAGRKNPAYSFDEEYNRTIGRLPENERRVLMNLGRDWYYQHTAPKNSTWDLETQGPHPDYFDTWWGRIWNTNDYSEFDPKDDKLTHPTRRKKAEGGVNQWNENYSKFNNNNNMRTSYFRDIAESMARDGRMDSMANGGMRMSQAPMQNDYFRDIASYYAQGGMTPNNQYYQDSGSPSMEVARRPTQSEFMEVIYDTLPAAWRGMQPRDAWNAFQQLTVRDQNRFAQNAGLAWTDVATVGTGMEGAGRRPARVPENEMTQVTGEAIPIYESLVRLNDLPMKADGTFITEDEWYALPIDTQASWAHDAALRSQEKIAGYEGDFVYEQRRPTYTGEDIYTPGQAAETPPMRKPTATGGGTGKRRKRKGGAKPAPQAPGTRTSTPATEEKRRGLSTQEMYGKGVPKRVLGGPNTIMDFFANARDGQFPSRLQDGQLMYYSDLEKAQFGKFIKGLGRTVYDFGRANLDAIGNTTGLFDLSNEKYKTKLGKKLSGTADKWFRGVGSVGRTALDLFVPGAGTALNIAGSALNPNGLGSKQAARDQQRKAATMGASLGTQGPFGMAQTANNMSGSTFDPQSFMGALTPGLMNMLPSLLGGPMSPGGATGYTTGNYGGNTGFGGVPGAMRNGGMPSALLSHMEFMSLFEDPQAYKKGSGPYLVY